MLTSCTFGASEYKGAPEALPPFEEIELRISVEVLPAAESGEVSRGSVSGGGAAQPADASHAIEVNGVERFGVEEFEVLPENPGGGVDTQAGSHPFQLSLVTTLNTRLKPASLTCCWINRSSARLLEALGREVWFCVTFNCWPFL